MKFSNKLLIVFLAIFFVQNISFLFGHVIESPFAATEILFAEDLFAALGSQKQAVIMGFMDNCPHCKSLMPFLNKLAQKYPTIQFFTVNGPRHSLHTLVAQQSKNQFKIPGFPSIVLVKNGKIVDLQIGGRTDALEDKIKKFFK